VYNSAVTLSALVEQLKPVLDQVASEYELILVNDASRDDSWSKVLRLMKEHPWVQGIDLVRNFGQHNALLCGVRAAKYEVIVTLDDDLQHPPNQIPLLLEKLAEGYDVVYGAPLKQNHGVFRNQASNLTKLLLQNAMGAQAASNISPFRAFRTTVRNAFASYANPFVNIDVLLSWGTTRFSVVRLRHEARAHGKSNYTFFKLVTHAFNMLTGYSVLPLQLASWSGFFMLAFGVFVLGYVLTRYFISGTVIPGFPFIASIIAMFSGAQLFALGIIGEYLSRIYLRTMDKPSYVVRPIAEARDPYLDIELFEVGAREDVA
jgi:undecaprenyl-phosphate 4-deoxy-4-formamido-L-arabinose transferase